MREKHRNSKIREFETFGKIAKCTKKGTQDFEKFSNCKSFFQFAFCQIRKTQRYSQIRNILQQTKNKTKILEMHKISKMRKFETFGENAKMQQNTTSFA